MADLSREESFDAVCAAIGKGLLDVALERDIAYDCMASERDGDVETAIWGVEYGGWAWKIDVAKLDVEAVNVDEHGQVSRRQL